MQRPMVARYASPQATVDEAGIRRIAAWMLRYGAYPMVVAASYGLFFTLERQGLAPMLAALVCAFTAAWAIALHERWQPYRASWRAGRRESGRDATYMLGVQFLMPELLALALLSLVGPALGWPASPLWPHRWPVVLQALLLFCIVDFLRYWVHRAGHANALLWRFHALHHAPERLHRLNVGNFHPAEKLLQFTIESAPFLLIGVDLRVLALHFLFYAVNGFYKHANCDIRFGCFNWIVNGPELHRWHHSRRVRESNRNFGGDLILWDLLFGTRFLPNDRDVGALGLDDPSYPTGLLGQIAAPFRRSRNQGGIA